MPLASHDSKLAGPSRKHTSQTKKLSVTRSHPHVHTRTRPVAQFPRPPLCPPKSKLLPFIQDYSKRGEAKIGFPENVPEEIRGSLMGAWEEV